MSFVHLRVHSFYTLKEGTASPEALAYKAKSMGMGSLALTDTMNLYGALRMVRFATAQGIQPITGAEILVGRAEPTRPVLLVQNPIGYRNLCSLLTKGHFQSRGEEPPRVDPSDLSSLSQGLICLDGGPMGLVGRFLNLGHQEEATKAVRYYRETFPPGCFYLELQTVAPRSLNRSLLDLAKQFKLPMVLTHPVYHAEPGEGLPTNKGPWHCRAGAHLLSPEEIQYRFREVPEALRSTVEIASRCGVAVPVPGIVEPTAYNQIPGEDDALLRRLAFEGLSKRYPETSGSLRERLLRELAVIQEMGFTRYFLILWDLVGWCKAQGIPVGPGRGSAVGSLTCYCLGITTVDPIRHNLYFERFLNPERQDFPDVDIDLCSRRKPEALAYLARRYGSDHVAQAGVISTLGARGAIREAGRLLARHDPSLSHSLAALLPRTRGTGGIRKAIASLPEFKRLNLKSKPVQDLLRTATFLEGLPTHVSIHASGVVISPSSLTETTPLQKGGTGEIITQLQPEDLKSAGLIKFDLLGLRNLTLIQDTLEMISSRGGPVLDAENTPENDPVTFQMLQRGESLGCFQLDSPGIRRLLERVRPTTYDDLIAVLSLYRPGPWEAGAVDAFVRRRQGKEALPDYHPKLRAILEETYGLLLYQEHLSLSVASEIWASGSRKTPSLRDSVFPSSDFVGTKVYRGISRRVDLPSILWYH